MELINVEQTIIVSELLAGYLNGTLTASEQAKLLEWINERDEHRDLFERICNQENLTNAFEIFNRFDYKDGLANVKAHPSFKAHQLDVVKAKIRRYTAAAAAVLVFLTIAMYFFNFQGSIKEGKRLQSGNEIKPGKQGATLTLSNGKTIKLNDVVSGNIIRQAGIEVIKTTDGQIIYKIIEKTGLQTDLTAINTLTTSIGETYRLQLPDGSLVYLNAASKLTYATSLNENGKRIVRLEGEGYFEIAKDKRHPFIVKSKGQEIEVLGTHFNVNAYSDESIVKTTLLEGAIRLSSPATPGMSIILKPNEQSILTSANEFKINEANTEEAIAWKNGYFRFTGQKIEDVMRILARWYNIDVSYEGKITDDGFNGRISRYKNIDEALKMLENTGLVHFKVEGRRVVVLK